MALLPAIPIAAQAAYHDIQWEALSTTLSEANRVPESELEPSLRAQCQTADQLGVQPAPAALVSRRRRHRPSRLPVEGTASLAARPRWCPRRRP